jgi:hypothetical protein
MKFLRIYILLSFCIVFGATFSQSRRFYDNNDYKKQRHELNFGLGVSSCQTDVGGSQYSEQELAGKFGGTIFRSIYDTDLSSSNFVLNAAYVYHFKNRINLRANLVYSRLSGNDKESEEFYRNNRNLNFRTEIIELTAITEFYIKKPTTGNKFNLKNVKGQKLAPNALASLGIYIVGGIGGFLYVPKAQNNFFYPNVYENKDFIPDNDRTTYHKLRPLHTEGQGRDDVSPGDDFNKPGKSFESGKTYSKFAVCIPFGLGIQKAFNESMGVKAEFVIRYSSTDYIDDVSGLYYNWGSSEENKLNATMSGTNSGGDYENPDKSPGTFRYVSYAQTTDANGDPIYPNIPIYNPNTQEGFLTIDNNVEYGGTNPWYRNRTYTEAGFKRGNPENKDYYAFLNVSFYKKFSSHGKVYKSIHSRERRRIKASF